MLYQLSYASVMGESGGSPLQSRPPGSPYPTESPFNALAPGKRALGRRLQVVPVRFFHDYTTSSTSLAALPGRIIVIQGQPVVVLTRGEDGPIDLYCFPPDAAAA